VPVNLVQDTDTFEFAMKPTNENDIDECSAVVAVIMLTHYCDVSECLTVCVESDAVERFVMLANKPLVRSFD